MAQAPTAWRGWELDAKMRLYAQARHRLWLQRLHDGQGQPPELAAGTCSVWYARGGRGSGKTRTGAETFAHWVLSNPPGDWGIVAPTFADARDKCVEGVSGVKKVFGPLVAKWNRSIGEMHLHTGARIMIDGGDDGALRIQGENLRGAWVDEPGLIVDWETTWDESLSFAVRLEPALIMATGTPKGKVGLVKALIEDPECVETYLRLADNEPNLSAKQLRRLKRRYEGTRVGRQELYGEVLEEVEGALWTWEMIEAHRVKEALRDLILNTLSVRTVVAVDPATTATSTSDETGIVAVARVAGTADILGGPPKPIETPDGPITPPPPPDHGYVLADRSGRYSPQGWAEETIKLYHELRADRIVVERNQGGDMVVSTLHSVDPNVPISTVWASKGKEARAEPTSALYEQGRFHHVGTYPELESEQTSWVPGTGASPNHLDALVWAATDLFDPEADAPDTVIAGISGEPGPADGIMDAKW
jgi:phage terminase large subunit-like protein